MLDLPHNMCIYRGYVIQHVILKKTNMYAQVMALAAKAPAASGFIDHVFRL
jgi:hypothetical protein